MSIYKDCDIRGVYGLELDEATAYDIGRAVGTKMQGKTMVVGGDARISTPALKEKLIQGMVDSGANILDAGLTPTPMFYFAVKHCKSDGGVTVTASHNPPKYNGFKMIFGHLPVQPKDVMEIRQLVEQKAFSAGQGSVTKVDVAEAYKAEIKALSKMYAPMKVVVDAGNGAESKVAPEVFRELGYEVVELYCEYDGTFPNRDPNPSVYKNIKTLQEKVLEEKAQLGVAFDGDGDRVVFVDDKGDILTSEESFVVMIQDYLKDKPSSVVYDLKSSSIVEREIVAHNSEAIMERSGHAFIKRTFLKNNSALAGEISGHFFFQELGYDDGLFAAVKMAEIVGKSGMRLSEISAKIQRTLITPDIRIPFPTQEQDGLLAKIEEMGQKYTVSKLDGVRVKFPNGWMLIRKSITEPCVTMRIEARDEAEMIWIKKWILEAAPELRGKHEAFTM